MRPLPVAHEEEMLRLREGVRQPDGGIDSVNIVGPHFQEIVAQARTLTAIAAMSARAVALTGSDVPQHLEAALLSPGALHTLGGGWKHRWLHGNFLGDVRRRLKTFVVDASDRNCR